MTVFCDNDQFRAPAPRDCARQCITREGPFNHLLKEHLLGPMSTEEIEVKLPSLPSSGSQPWRRKK